MKDVIKKIKECIKKNEIPLETKTKGSELLCNINHTT